jgi:hypothetical protein
MVINTKATVIVEESDANKSGKLCIQNIYKDDNYIDLEKINSKVTCVKKVSVDDKGAIQNLNCPNDPFFEDYFSNGYSHRYKNNCLRNDRNSTVQLFENVDCNCVDQSLKNETKGENKDYSKRIDNFKNRLRDKALDNLGKRLTNKITNLKKADRSLSWDNDQKYCFNENTQIILNKMITNSTCDTDLMAERINKAFGENLDINVAKGTNHKDALSQLIQGLQAPQDNIKETGKNSCFPNSKEFGNYYNSWSNHHGFVSLNDTFGDFLKNHDPSSYSIKEDFYNYAKKNNIKLHPTLEIIAQNKLGKFLSDVKQALTTGEVNLEDFLLANNKKWQLEASKIVNKTCAYVVKDIKNLICPKADFAFDDPEFVEMIYEEGTDNKEQVRENINNDDLELKALYCRNKEIHQVDHNAKTLEIKAKYKKKRNSQAITRWISSTEFSSIINDNTISSVDAAREKIEGLFKKSFENHSLKPEDATNRKLGILNAFIDNTFMNGKVLQNFSDSIRSGSRANGLQHMGHIMRATQTIKQELLNQKLNTVKEMGKEIYPHMKSDLTSREFQRKFLTSYSERNYNKTFTEYFKHYDATPFEKNEPCAESFNKIYCSNESKVMSMVADGMSEVSAEKRQSCFRHKLPEVMKDYLKTNFTGVKSPSSICHYSKSIINSSKDTQDRLLSHVTSFFKNKEIYEKGGYCQQKTSAQLFSEDTNNFRIEDLDRNAIGYVEGTSRGLPGDFQVERSIKSVANSVKEEAKTSSNYERPNVFAKELFENAKAIDNKTSEFFKNTNSFNNFNTFKSNDRSTIEEEEKLQREEDREKAVSESEQNLRDYIAELEEKIKENEKKVANSSSTTETSELKQLRESLESMKQRSKDLKDKLAKKVEQRKTNNSTTRTAPKFAKRPAVFNSRTPSSTKVNQDYISPKSENIQTKAPVQTSTPINNSISLNAQSDSSTQQSSANSSNKIDGKIVSVSYDNQSYEIKLKVSKSGEVICQFSKEDEVEVDQEKLKSICEEYKENNPIRDIASLSKKEEKTKKVSKEEKIEKAKRSQKFKVQDLNQMLKN